MGDVMHYVSNWAGVLALLGWLGQLWRSRILAREQAAYQREMEKLKAELERLSWVHRVQFEKEFSIYLDLWKLLVDLRNAASGLRPPLEFDNPNESDADRKKVRLSKYCEAYQGVYEQFEKHRPFYSNEVYKAVSELCQVAGAEASEFAHTNQGNPAYYDHAIANCMKLKAQSDAICESIRNRLSAVRVDCSRG